MAIRSVTVRYAADVGSLVRGLDEAAKANDKLATKTDDTGKHIDNLAKGGAAIGLLAGVAVAKFSEFGATMSAVAAAAGATGAELKELENAAVQAGQATQYSATEAAQGITELAKAGVSTSNILKGGLTGALSLAAAGQIEVADAAEIAATAMTQFRLQGSQVSHVADLLAAGANQAQGGVGDLGMALKQAGLVASQTGLTIEETAGGLTAFANAGLIGSDAGTSLKSMLQRLTPQSKEAKAAMDALGISAYDSQGQFIGLASFADNLRSSLQDLTPEQRNSALATIFGTDAVRAASIMYDQGGEKIQGWIDKVNQQGYAAKTAATLNDNLKGDLERLSGAFETTLIQAGSGANDTLRTLTQTATALLDVVGQIPGPIMMGGAALVAFSLAGRKVGQLASTAFGPLSGAMGRFRAELATTAATAPVAATGLGRVGVAAKAAGTAMGGMRGVAGGAMGLLGGPWGIAMTGATIAVTAFATAQKNAEAAAADLTATIDAQTGALTEGSKTWVLDQFKLDINEDDVQTLVKLGVNFGEAADAAMRGGDAMDAYRDKLSALAAANPDYGKQINGLSSSIENQNEIVQRAQKAFENDRKLKEQAGIATDGAADSTKNLAEVVSQTSGVMDAASDPMSGINYLLIAMGAKSEDASKQLGGLKDAIDLLSGGALAARAASRETADAIDRLGEAAKAKASKTKTAAQVSREFQAAIDGVARATQSEIGVLMENGAQVSTLKAKYDQGRAAIEKQMAARGLHGAALKAETDKIIGTRAGFALLLAEYAKTPGAITTTVTNTAAAAKQKVREYWTVVDGVPTKVTTTVTAQTAQAVNAFSWVKDLIAGIPRSVTTVVNVVRNALGIPSARGNIFDTVKTFNGGGTWSPDVANGHLPHIAPAGSWRIFGEDETGGEAYLPLANDSRRPRARALAEEVVARFGGSVAWNAYGSVSGGDVAAIRSLILAIKNPLADLAVATSALVAQQRSIASASSAVTAARRVESGARLKAESATRLNNVDIAQRDALKKQLIELKRRADATKGNTREDKAYADAQRRLAYLNIRVTESTKAKTAATKAYNSATANTRAATTRLADAQKALADAQKGAAEEQQQIADAASRVAERFRDAYGPKSVDPAAWIRSMTAGSADLQRFLAQIQTLRSAGLNEALVQQITDAGVTNGGNLAANILADRSKIAGLNSSWAALVGASTNLGLGSVDPRLAPTGIDYAKLAGAVASALPLKAIADTLGRLPANVESGAAKGMLAIAAADRRTERASVGR